MFSFRDKPLIRSNSDLSLLKRENIIDKLRSFMSIEEMNKSPALASALTHNKRITFNLLTPNDHKIIPIKIKNPKKQHLIDNINSLKKNYFNYNKSIKHSLEDIRDMSKRNSQFIQRYNNMVSKSGIADKNAFSDIKAEYDKMDYKLPNLEKNLFKSNLLLPSNDTDLKKYINFGFGTKKSNKKAISFLERMNDNINNDLKDDNQAYDISFYNKINTNLNNRYKASSLYALNKMSKEQLKEILSYKREIKKIKRTIDSIQDIDYFFSSDNKEYLDTLRYFNSRNTSANFSTSLGNNNSSVFDKNNFGNKSNILSLRNISKFTFDENESKSIKSKNKILKYNIDASNNSENKSLTQLMVKPKKKRRKVIKRYINNNNYKEKLETLYNKITTSNDATLYNKKIKNYLRFRRFRLDPQINKNNICNNMENLREMICKDDSIKKVIYFRKNMGNFFDEIQGINNKESEIEKKVDDIEDQMIKAFSEMK